MMENNTPRKKLQFKKRKSVTTEVEEWDDTFKLMSWWDSKLVKQSQVMVVGAGALGNEVLKNLSLLNVGKILIVDFDTIEYANLCRSVLFREEDCQLNKLKSEIAAQRIKELNPNIKVQTINGDIMIDVGLGVFRRMDAIIGCLDNRLARLFINRYAFQVGKTWIDGAIENLSGQINVYKPKTSCYECYLSEADWNNITEKLSCADIAQRNSSMGRVPTTPISSSIIGAMQVQEALKVLHGFEKQSLAGEQIKYDGMNNWILQYDTEELKTECDSHYQIVDEELIETKELSANNSIQETLDWLKNYFNEDVNILLNYKVILEVTGMQSEKTKPIIMAEPHFSTNKHTALQEIPGENILITKYTDIINSSFENKELSLREIGVPYLQILKVETSKDIHFVELTGDLAFLDFE